jgi:alcohol dehydrogenase (cytochrome c)
LTADAAITIGGVADGAMPAGFREALASAAPAAAGGGGPTGLTVPGNITSLSAVTDRELLDPPPSEWLMIRGNYRAWNYSELASITRNNVAGLQLQWVWSMTDGGWSEPAPLEHDGVLYLYNQGNVIQALDARSGELLWENRVGPNLASGASRGLAIYDNKIFVATSDARLVALDARTGQTVWETIIGDRTDGGFTAPSGPIVIHGKVVQGMGGCTQFRKEKCFVSAYDAKDGHELWRFRTVATGNEPGADTWGGLPDIVRAGGDTWITGSYDPDLNTSFWGVGQA